MKNKYINFIILLILSACVVSALAYADEVFFVNDDASMLPANMEGVYAIGSSGTDLLAAGKVYALTGKGLQMLGSDEPIGGGGLTYDDETIEIHSDRVKVGLAYSFSSARDSSVPSALLENVNGSGFSIGTYDTNGIFTELAFADADILIVRPGPDNSVDVYLQDGEERIASLDATSRDAYLTVRAVSTEDIDPLTKYAGIEYYGEFCFAVLANDRLTVVNYLDIEQYVMGVCAIEMSERWPIEALKAQAIAARTFVQRMIGKSVYFYNCGFDVTADTYTQAYQGTRNVGDNIRRAVNETENYYLTQDGKLIDALYSAADGGATEDAENVFGYPNSFLIGVFDPYEAMASSENPYASWSVTFTPSQLGAMLGIGPVQTVTATKSRTGNVIKLELITTGGQHATLIRDNCRTQLHLRSIRYDVSRDSSGNFVFKGSGFGHNVGMSQWGAYAMAKYYEKDYRFILGFYYTDIGLSRGELPPKPEPPFEEEPSAEEEPPAEEKVPGETTEEPGENENKRPINEETHE